VAIQLYQMTKYLDYMKIPGRLKFISFGLMNKTCSNVARARAGCQWIVKVFSRGMSCYWIFIWVRFFIVYEHRFANCIN